MRSANGTAPDGRTSKTEADRFLSQFWSNYVESGRAGFGYVARHPFQALRALRATRRLPVIPATKQSDTPWGREVRRVLDLKGPLGLPARWWGYAVLPVLEDAADFLQSPEAKRLRRNLRLADEAGISVRLVAAGERADLLAQANRRERLHPDESYRVLEPDNADLLDHELWIVAEDNDLRPLLLGVAAIDGEFAILRYFRTLGDGEDYSLGRYCAHHGLVVELAERGVRWLLDSNPPAAQTNGVRLYQRIVGFRYKRIRRAGDGLTTSSILSL